MKNKLYKIDKKFFKNDLGIYNLHNLPRDLQDLPKWIFYCVLELKSLDKVNKEARYKVVSLLDDKYIKDFLDNFFKTNYSIAMSSVKYNRNFTLFERELDYLTLATTTCYPDE